LSYDMFRSPDRTRNLNLSLGCSFGRITRVEAHGLVNGSDAGPYFSFAAGPALEYQFPAGVANSGALGIRSRYMWNLYHSRNFTDVGAFARFGFRLKKVQEEQPEAM
jgi:hypothetical protein